MHKDTNIVSFIDKGAEWYVNNIEIKIMLDAYKKSFFKNFGSFITKSFYDTKFNFVYLKFIVIKFTSNFEIK